MQLFNERNVKLQTISQDPLLRRTSVEEEQVYVEELYQVLVQPPVQPLQQLEEGCPRRQVMFPRRLADFDLT